jgi:hypothetical protein
MPKYFIWSLYYVPFHRKFKNNPKKFAYFSKIYYHTILQDPTLSSGSVAPISEVCGCYIGTVDEIVKK